HRDVRADRRPGAGGGRGPGRTRHRAQACCCRRRQRIPATRSLCVPHAPGAVQLAAGARAQALASYEDGLAILRAQIAADPDNPIWQRDVTLSLDRIGDVRLAVGDRAGALAAYEEGLAIRRKLAAADPGNTEWQSNLAASLDRMGRELAIAGR